MLEEIPKVLAGHHVDAGLQPVLLLLFALRGPWRLLAPAVLLVLRSNCEPRKRRQYHRYAQEDESERARHCAVP